MDPSFQDLPIWQASVALAAEVIALTDDFPWEQRGVLVEQMQRAAISVASNIAEGQGRISPKEFRWFLGTARGSLFELITQLEIANRAGLVPHGRHAELEETARAIGDGINDLLRGLPTFVLKT